MSERRHWALTMHRSYWKVRIIGVHLVGSAAIDSMIAAQPGGSATMTQWADQFDAFLSFNERGVLTHLGWSRMGVVQKSTIERFAMLDAIQHATETVAAYTNNVGQ